MKRRAAILMLAAAAATATAATPAANPAPVRPESGWDESGRFRNGPWLFCLDDNGWFSLLLDGRPVLLRMRLGLDLNGSIEPTGFAGRRIERGPRGVKLTGSVPGHPVSLECGVTSDPEGRLVFTLKRHGKLPAGGRWNHFSFNLSQQEYPHDSFRLNGKPVALPREKPASSWLHGDIRRLEISGRGGDRITVESSRDFAIQDNRPWGGDAPAWVVHFPLPDNEPEVDFTVTLTLATAPDWKPCGPAVRLSRIGYAASGGKLAVLEWAPGTPRPPDEAVLVDASGKEILRGRFGATTAFMGWSVAAFDFTPVRTPGDYRLRWSGGNEGPIAVRDTVFSGLWKDSISRFIPWQMCHATVNLGAGLPVRPACHRDDAARVAAYFPGVDGFVSYGCEDAPWKAGETVPCARGGWHDAGDYDLNVSAQGFTVWTLALAAEEFGLGMDEAALDLGRGAWTAGKGDGIPDVLQHVAWGASWLLSLQAPDGRVAVGVIEQPKRYGASVLPEKATDNQPGTGDERQLYPDYHPDVQLKAATALAAASRALRRHYPDLAEKSLAAAERAWRVFATRSERYQPTVYFSEAGGPELKGRDDQVLTALTELWLTTKSASYLEAIGKMRSAIGTMKLDWPWPNRTDQYGFWFCAPALARLAVALPEGELRETCRSACRRYQKDNLGMRLAPKPYPFHVWEFHEWGVSGTLLGRVFDIYWLSRALPGEASLALALPGAYWQVGLHPLNDYSMVAGVGKEWTRYLYNGQLFGYFGTPTPMTVPGAAIPGIASLPGTGVLLYEDAPGNFRCNEACIYTAASWVFAAAALERAGY